MYIYIYIYIYINIYISYYKKNSNAYDVFLQFFLSLIISKLYDTFGELLYILIKLLKIKNKYHIFIMKIKYLPDALLNCTFIYIYNYSKIINII